MWKRLCVAAVVVPVAMLESVCSGPHTVADRIAREFRTADSLTYALEVDPGLRRRVVVRLTRSDSTFSALAISYALPDSTLREADLMAPVLRIDTTTRSLSRSNWDAIERVLDDAGFWTMPQADPGLPGAAVEQAGGTLWRLRAETGSHTRLVERHFPDSVFVNAVQFMLGMAGVDTVSAYSR
jgi:hypothetical protein